MSLVNREFGILTEMKIDGKALAQLILDSLKTQVPSLPRQPTLAVILIGDDPASQVYITQKQKAAHYIGAHVVLSRDISDLHRFNQDPGIDGIIVQRPVPPGTPDYIVQKNKDVDGFESNSPFEVPVALAVWHIIKSSGIHPKTYVVLGKGSTAGAPIAKFLTRQGYTPEVIDSKTINPKNKMIHADCIISCVGSERIVTSESIKPGSLLISVGIWRDTTGKLRGDYDEEDIAGRAGAFTPTPGGVGPVNVACLMKNLLKACTMNEKGET